MREIEELLSDLNDWQKCPRVVVPEGIEKQKELEFIIKSRIYSNEGVLSGLNEISSATKAIEIGLTPGDFDCSGGIGNWHTYFFYGWCHSLKEINETHEYYEKIIEELKILKVSKTEFENCWRNNNTDLLPACFNGEIERDLENYIFSEKLKSQLLAISICLRSEF